MYTDEDLTQAIDVLDSYSLNLQQAILLHDEIIELIRCSTRTNLPLAV